MYNARRRKQNRFKGSRIAKWIAEFFLFEIARRIIRRIVQRIFGD